METATTKLVLCDCVSKFQDSEYGDKRRLANKGEKGSKCTVCGKVHK